MSSADMRLSAASEEATGSEMSEPLAVGLGGPLDCNDGRARLPPRHTPATLCRTELPAAPSSRFARGAELRVPVHT